MSDRAPTTKAAPQHEISARLSQELRSDRFAVETAQTWQRIEHGSAPAGPVYLPPNLTPQDYAILANELAPAPEGRAKLLPTGTVVMRRIAQREITAGANRTVATLFAFDGLDLQPKYVWLDDARRLFFNVDVAYSPATIREGFEDAVPELRRAQNEADDQWCVIRRLARQCPAVHSPCTTVRWGKRRQARHHCRRR